MPKTGLQVCETVVLLPRLSSRGAFGDLDLVTPINLIAGRLGAVIDGSGAADRVLEVEDPVTIVRVEIRDGSAAQGLWSDPEAVRDREALEADALAFGCGTATSPGAADAVHAGLMEVGERLAPYAGARDTILTFDEHRSMRDAFAPHVADRLESIAANRDPDGVLVANHVAD